ncbi:formimidoylglutamase [Flavobacteriaceae bacterium TK19130]|nr:formimidoylglutamase [Thermobacterium salinum]
MLSFYAEKNIAEFTNPRKGETKLGQAMATAANWGELEKSNAKYVLVGIPEDIGVRANHGKAGTSQAWKSFLSSFCNLQANPLLSPDSVLVLGEIDCAQQMVQAETLDTSADHYYEKLGQLVRQIDDMVTTVISKIVGMGKIPIVIGGGHNNSYGNLKGSATALDGSINCINFDAHTDFRALEHRHSGNGFSYAFEEGFLNRYFIFGLHRNYTSQNVFDTMARWKDRIQFETYENIAIDENLSFEQSFQEAGSFLKVEQEAFGIELDLDAIQQLPSSAMTPSGFVMAEARMFLRHFSRFQQCRYIHLCEAAPTLSSQPSQVGKALAYLVSDCIAS